MRHTLTIFQIYCFILSVFAFLGVTENGFAERITVTGSRLEIPKPVVIEGGNRPDPAGASMSAAGRASNSGGGRPLASPKPWPKFHCKAKISCWSQSSIGHTCEVSGLYLTADEAHLKLQQINCCAGTVGGGQPNGYAEWNGCGVF